MKYFSFLALFFFTAQVNAQIKWGWIDSAQFAMRYCSFDSTANAVVLLDSENVNFDAINFLVTYDVYKRVKIFNKEGLDEATVKIPYFGTETISDLSAQVINKNEEGIIKIIKLKPHDFFDEVVSDYMWLKKFALAEVKEGSVIEYQYTITSKSWGLRDWYFQGAIPVMRSSVNLKVPEFLHYSPYPTGNVAITEYTSTSYNQNLPGYYNVSGNDLHYAMKNVPALKEEPFITTIKDYRAHISFPLVSSRFPRQKFREYSNTWDVITQRLMKATNFGEHLNELIGEQLNAARLLTEGLEGKQTKAEAIYNHLRAKMKWNKVFSLYGSNRLSKSYSDNAGNSADINMLLISMLRVVGIKADPVLISTRFNGMIQRAYPAFSQFNNVIVMAEVDTGWILLDAAGSFNPYGLLDPGNLNSPGLRIVKKADESDGSYKGEWVDIIPSKNSVATLNSTFEIDSAGNQKSKTILTATDYSATVYRSELEKDSIHNFLRTQLKLSDEFELKGQKVYDQKEVDKRIKFVMDLVKSDSTTSSNMLYINPFPVKFQSENPFKLSKRSYPVDYGYPLQQNILTTVVVPANYKVVELPKSIKLKLEDGSASFSFLIGLADNNIQINSSLKITQSRYLPEIYDDLKMLYAKMIDTYNSSIVLERIK